MVVHIATAKGIKPCDSRPSGSDRLQKMDLKVTPLLLWCWVLMADTHYCAMEVAAMFSEVCDLT